MRTITIQTVAATVAAIIFMLAGRSAVASGDAEAGRKAFRVCVACHSVKKGAHRTGPSLADIWGRKAGTIDGFRRYSRALKNSDIVWNENTLDKWLKNPKAFIPGNRMVFRGVNDQAGRADMIAFLKGLSGEGSKAAGGKKERDAPNLKELGLNNQITAITHCADTYQVSTANGETHPFWEFNIRFKSDSSENGPPAGKPVIIPGGMRGDRAFVIFRSPQEISPFIKRRCEK